MYREVTRYIEGRTDRRLRWIRNADSKFDGMTSDEVLDRIANEFIETNYPTITEAESGLREAEKKFQASLKGS